MNKNIFYQLTIRHAFRIGSVITIATLINHYYSFSHEYWIVLVAWIVCQSPQEIPVRYGMIFFLLSLISVLIGSLFTFISLSLLLCFLFVTIFFIVIDEIIYINRLLINNKLFLVFFLLMGFNAALIAKPASQLIQNRLLDMIMGGVIGLVGQQIILPINVNKVFRHSIVSLLKSLTRQTFAMSQYFTQSKKPVKELKVYAQYMWKSLVNPNKHYPEWVYERGFNPELRAGYRFFLLHLEWLTEIYCSLNVELSSIPKEWLQPIKESFAVCMENNNTLIKFLIQFFEEKKDKKTVSGIETQSDFKSDISELEKVLQRHIPGSIELLDVAPEYIALTKVVTEIKDMRIILLQLVSALE